MQRPVHAQLVVTTKLWYVDDFCSTKVDLCRNKFEVLFFEFICAELNLSYSLKFNLIFKIFLVCYLQTGPVRLFVPYKRRKRDSIGSVSMLPTGVKKQRLNSSGNAGNVNTSPASSASSTGQSPSKDSEYTHGSKVPPKR